MAKTEKMKKEDGAKVGEILGKGAASPPAEAPAAKVANPKRIGTERSNVVLEIELSRLMADPDQPRKEFPDGSIESMAKSLLEHRQIQPISVVWSEENQMYRVVDGERRLRGAIKAGVAKLLCVVEEKELPKPKLRIRQIVANVQREDLSPLDMARQLKELIEDHHFTQTQLSAETGIERTKIVRLLSHLDLPHEVQEMVETGAMPSATAYELSKAKTPEQQIEVARTVIDKDLTRVETAEEVQKVAAREPAPAGEGRGGASKKKGSAAKKPKKKPDLEYDRVFHRSGIKLKVDSKRGFTLAQLLEVLEHARDLVEAEMGVPARMGDPE